MSIIIFLTILLLLNTFYVPWYVNEYSIPIIFRSVQTNIFYDRQKAKCFVFFVTIVLHNCMVHFLFYRFDLPCLTTMNNVITVIYADRYQYAMIAFLWVVITPLFIYFYAVLARDNIKLIVLPIVVANVVFLILMSILTLIVIFYTITCTTVEN